MTLEELSRETGLTPRTIRFYIGQGLIPPPRSRGRGAHYSDEHLLGLRRVMELRAQRFGLQEIEAIIQGSDKRNSMSEDKEGTYTEYGTDPGSAVQEYVHRARYNTTAVSTDTDETTPFPSRWTRHPVVPGIEIHVEASISATERRTVEQATRTLREELAARRRAQGGTPS